MIYFPSTIDRYCMADHIDDLHRNFLEIVRRVTDDDRRMFYSMVSDCMQGLIQYLRTVDIVDGSELFRLYGARLLYIIGNSDDLRLSEIIDTPFVIELGNVPSGLHSMNKISIALNFALAVYEKNFTLPNIDTAINIMRKTSECFSRDGVCDHQCLSLLNQELHMAAPGEQYAPLYGDDDTYYQIFYHLIG